MQVRSARETWQTALGQLEVQVSKANFRTWLKDTVGLVLENDRFVVGAPNSFVTECLDKRLSSLVVKTLASVVGRELEVSFEVCQPSGGNGGNGEAHTSSNHTSATHTVANACPANLNPRYTFNSFIVGSSNRLAQAAAQAVAENPGRGYNPLFIYSDSGLGKTHLLHAIGHQVYQKHLNMLYVTSEQFTNEFINAIRERKTDDFRAKYRSVDILMVDDIHFIADKEQTQEGFFHTFNDLHNTSRQIVITSDRPPKSMPLLEDRLRSRFEWGLIADIQPPDLETRLAVLRAKADQQQADVPNDVLELIARKAQRNIRELEGSLNRVVAYARLTEKPITSELAAQAIADMDPERTRRRAVSPGLIIATVSDHFGLDPVSLSGKMREQPIVLARQIAMYLMREETPLSLTDIGKELGRRDHTTVLHACRKIAEEMEANTHFRREVLELRETLRPD
ncbi:MAG: chromosomal replication initiator protein DnaA [Chloroflexi bacterium]|nr:chromosomal replication initiator protein DnaA [Chloroflexota bacterium]